MKATQQLDGHGPWTDKEKLRSLKSHFQKVFIEEKKSGVGGGQ
jgi:hypothetical protein